MNRRSLFTLYLLTGTLLMSPALLIAADCSAYYKQNKSSFLSTLTLNSSAIHAELAQCIQANFCAHATDPDQCLQKLHIYNYYAAAASKQQTQAYSGWQEPQADNNNNQAVQPKSSYNFTFKPPIARAENNNSGYTNNYTAPVTNSQTGTEQKEIYKDIKF